MNYYYRNAYNISRTLFDDINGPNSVQTAYGFTFLGLTVEAFDEKKAKHFVFFFLSIRKTC